MSAERHQNFERLFEDSVDPAFVIEPAGDRIVAVNHAGCAMLGTHTTSCWQRPSLVHPAELPQFRRFLNQVRREGRGSSIKLTCRTKSGTFLPTEMSLHAFAAAAAPTFSGSCSTAASIASRSRRLTLSRRQGRAQSRARPSAAWQRFPPPTP